MEGVKVSKIVKAMALKSFIPEIDLKQHVINQTEVNRPALQLTGYFEHFEQTRVEIIGTDRKSVV